MHRDYYSIIQKKLARSKSIHDYYDKNGCKTAELYRISISGISSSFLIKQGRKFCDVAWGDNLASNQTLQSDEKALFKRLRIKRRHVVWEPGCGSGRILRHLLKISDHVVGTDFTKHIVASLKKLPDFEKTKIVQDDVLKTRLPKNHFDFVIAIENFLGMLVTKKDRLTAVKNMIRCTKRGGYVVLGFRIMGKKSEDQLCAIFGKGNPFVVVHVFSHSEIKSLCEAVCRQGSVILKKIIHTKVARESGGTLSYVMLQRV